MNNYRSDVRVSGKVNRRIKLKKRVVVVEGVAVVAGVVDNSNNVLAHTCKKNIVLIILYRFIIKNLLS